MPLCLRRLRARRAGAGCAARWSAVRRSGPGRLGLRAGRRTRPRPRERALPGAERHAAAGPGAAGLRRPARHPLPAGPRALARRRLAVRGDVLPPRHATSREPVRIHEVDAPGRCGRCACDRSDFDYGKNTLPPQAWGDLGHAGLRIHYPLNTPAYKDELIVFLGASYFRALGAGQQYGLSARGLAIDTVGGSGPEEFPRFTEFWLERPASAAPGSWSCTRCSTRRAPPAPTASSCGPGAQTVVEVRARVFLRETARADRDARARAAHQHVPVRREPAARRRLPPRGARLRRPDGGQRRRRMAVAAAAEPAARRWSPASPWTACAASA